MKTSSSVTTRRDDGSTSVEPHTTSLEQTIDAGLSSKMVSHGTRSDVDVDLTALAVIDSAASAQEHSRLSQTPQAPVFRLPPEVVVAIFEIYVSQFQSEVAARTKTWRRKDPRMTLANSDIAWIASLTHVCQEWRRIALGCSDLWKSTDLAAGTEWCEEMVVRSNSVPLTLYASDFKTCDSRRHYDPTVVSSPPCALKVLFKRTALSSHLHHLKDLTLMGCSATVMQIVSALATTPAPILQSLTVYLKPHPGTKGWMRREGAEYPVVPATFIAPRLRKLTLESCSLPWTCPVFKNLTHLEVASQFKDPLARTGSFMDLLDALEATSHALEDLCFRYIIPVDYVQMPVSRPVITLQALTKIALFDSAGACITLLSQLDIPICIDFDLWCEYIGDDDVHCAGTLPFVSDAVSRVQASENTLLSLTVHCSSNRLVAAAFPKELEHETRYAFELYVLKVLFNDWAMPDSEEEAMEIIETAIGLLAVETLTKLKFDGSDWTKEQWIRFFSRTTHVVSISARDETGSSLITALDSDLYASEGEPVPPSITADRRLFPHLQTLSLEHVDLTQVMPDDEQDLGEILARCLDARSGSIQKLVLRRCELSAAAKSALERVVDLDWEEYITPPPRPHFDGSLFIGEDGRLYFSGDEDDSEDDTDTEEEEGEEEEEKEDGSND
ncbi:hypothetical protein OF83DRAFT_1285282 [Amylostereum chailletii]|nr:hypothetical protein OF83DRAFT_1285282 [Amylostereum chailletii]